MTHDMDENELTRLAARVAEKMAPSPQQRVWEWILKLSVPATILLFTWVVAWASGIEQATRENRNRLDIIDATRFTASDGAKLGQTMLQTVGAMTQPLTRIEAQNAQLMIQVQRVEDRVRELEAEKRER